MSQEKKKGFMSNFMGFLKSAVSVDINKEKEDKTPKKVELISVSSNASAEIPGLDFKATTKIKGKRSSSSSSSSSSDSDKKHKKGKISQKASIKATSKNKGKRSGSSSSSSSSDADKKHKKSKSSEKGNAEISSKTNIPSVGGKVKNPKADIDLNINAGASANIDIKKPHVNIDLKGPKSEITSKGPKGDIHKKSTIFHDDLNVHGKTDKHGIDLGINLPSGGGKVKKPKGEIDLDLNAGADAKLDIKKPHVDIDLKGPKADIDLKGPKLDVDLDVDGKKKKHGIDLGFNLPSFGGKVKKPKGEIDLDLNAGGESKLDIKKPHGDIDLKDPKADIDLDLNAGADAKLYVKKPHGDIDLKGSKLDVGLDVDGKKKKPVIDLEMNLPSLGGSAKKKGKKPRPEIDLDFLPGNLDYKVDNPILDLNLPLSDQSSKFDKDPVHLDNKIPKSNVDLSSDGLSLSSHDVTGSIPLDLEIGNVKSKLSSSKESDLSFDNKLDAAQLNVSSAFSGTSDLVGNLGKSEGDHGVTGHPSSEFHSGLSSNINISASGIKASAAGDQPSIKESSHNKKDLKVKEEDKGGFGISANLGITMPEINIGFGSKKFNPFGKKK